MAEDLTKLWGNLTLTEEEDGAEVEIQAGELDVGVTLGKACVVGKLIADHMVSKEIIRSDLMRWWKPEGNISFKILGENLFLIEFTDKRDKERVLEGRPWIFEGNLFLIEDYDGCAQPSDFSFDKAAFWVRMINLPLACMGNEIGRKIGATVGVVEAVDTEANGMGWGEFLRVKILLDLTKPVLRGRKINIQGKPVWITFQYERLPKFCFLCGVMSHGKAGCPNRSTFRNQEPTPRYGPSLRAVSPTRRGDRPYGRHFTRKGQATADPASRGDQYGGSWRGSQRTREDGRKMAGPESFGAGREDDDVEPRAGAFNAHYGRRRYGDETDGVNDGDRRDFCQKEKELNKESGDEGSYRERNRNPTYSGNPHSRGYNKEKDTWAARGGPQDDIQRSPGLELDGRGDVKLGPGEKVSSPSFMGPLFSELEKTLKGPTGSNGCKLPTGLNGQEDTMVTWKRVDRGDITQQKEITLPVKQGIGKKLGLNGEDKNGGSARKGQKTSLIAVDINGSGMAEAATQPR